MKPDASIPLFYEAKSLTSFAQRSVIGLVFITVLWLSGVIAVGAGSAWLFRTLDGNQARYFLRALGFSDDVGRAFFPSFVLGVAWLLAWGFSYWQNRSAASGKVARVFLACLVASLLMAFAMLLGTGSIDMGKIAGFLHLHLDESTITKIQDYLKIAIVVPILLFLLPYFRPSRLLKSGRDPRAKWWERAIFKFAGLALLIGVPLLCFGLFARENISNWNTDRSGVLAANDVNWRELMRRMDKKGELGKRLWTSQWKFKSANDLKNCHVDKGEKQFCALGARTIGSGSGGVLHVLVGAAFASASPLATKNGGESEKAVSGGKVVALRTLDLSEGIYDSELLFTIANDYVTKIKKKHKEENGQAGEITFNDLVSEIDELNERIAEKDDSLLFHQRWIHFAELLLEKVRGSTDDEITAENDLFQLYKLQRDSYFLKLAALAIINQSVLLDEMLYEAIDNEINNQQQDNQPSRKQEKELWELIQEAKELQKRSGGDDPVQTTNINRQLLTAYFGKYGENQDKNVVQAKNETKSLTVVLQKDQQSRLTVFWWSLGIFLVFGFIVNLNMTSLQGYFRNQVAKTWIAAVHGFQRQIPLARLDTTAQGHPYHLICTTANFIRRQERAKGATDHFLFSNFYCGSHRTGYRRTSEFCGGSYDLASAIALSGAAVSPAQVKNLLLVVLLFTMNLRLGQWLPNPGYKAGWPAWLSHALSRWPSPFLVLASLLRRSENRAYCLVSDGGHFENLGIGPLLNRRCRLIISSDAGFDPNYEFLDFVSLLRRERTDHGVQISALDSGVARFDDLLPDETEKVSKAHWVVVRIDYPDRAPSELPHSYPGASTGYLIYIKPTFIDDEELDLATQRRVNPYFPHDPTSDQFYPPDKFESYRQLGFNIGIRLCRQCFHNFPLRTWTFDALAHAPPPDKEPAVELNHDRPEPARNLPPSEIDERIQQVRSDGQGDPAESRQSVEFLAEKMLDENSEISQDDRKRIVHTLVDVFRARERDVLLRLIVAESLAKVPTEYEQNVRRPAIDTLLDKKEHEEIRMAAVHILAVVGLGRNTAYLNSIAKLCDKPKVPARIRDAARHLLDTHHRSKSESKTPE